MHATVKKVIDDVEALPAEVVSTFKKITEVRWFGMALKMEQHDTFCTAAGVKRQVDAFSKPTGLVYTINKDGQMESHPVHAK